MWLYAAAKQGQTSCILVVADVIALDDSSFQTQVLGSKDLWFIEFYAPW